MTPPVWIEIEEALAIHSQLLAEQAYVRFLKESCKVIGSN